MICTECGKDFAAGHGEDVCEDCQQGQSEELHRQNDPHYNYYDDLFPGHEDDEEEVWVTCTGCGELISEYEYYGSHGLCQDCQEESSWFEDEPPPDKGKVR
jgi:hypothetical protein